MKQLPYGISDFKRIRRDDMYYVDKTMYLPLLEKENSYLLMIRPRRFGKSLFLSMMDAYYDVNMGARFKELFGDLWIGVHPTPLANKYQIMQFDFSLAGGNLSDLEEKFNQYCNTELDDFIRRYKEFYEPDIVNAVFAARYPESKLDIITRAAKRLEYRLYLLVDEYDNFTNNILANYGHEKFEELTHAEGFYRNFFKHFKGTFERILMFGVSPVTLDDLTSGYNIDWNISNSSTFNSMLGFEENEVRQMLRYYNGKVSIMGQVEDIISDMKPWYDNYCFALKSYGTETVYNCDMALYYIHPLLRTGIPPENLIDKNVKMDTSKLQMLVSLEKGVKRKDWVETIENIANRGFVNMHLITSFPARELRDGENFLSLMYYYGMLTIGGGDSGIYRMIIPNECVRHQYWRFVIRLYQQLCPIPIKIEQDEYRQMIFEGLWREVIKKIGEAYENLSSVRDAKGGEFNVQGFFKAWLGVSDYSILRSETELNFGYSDFLMLPMINHYPGARHCYIFEIKYVKSKEKENIVQKKYQEGESQIQKYANSSTLKRAFSGCTLHGIVIMFHGPHMEQPRLVLEKEI